MLISWLALACAKQLSACKIVCPELPLQLPRDFGHFDPCSPVCKALKHATDSGAPGAVAAALESSFEDAICTDVLSPSIDAKPAASHSKAQALEMRPPSGGDSGKQKSADCVEIRTPIREEFDSVTRPTMISQLHQSHSQHKFNQIDQQAAEHLQPTIVARLGGGGDTGRTNVVPVRHLAWGSKTTLPHNNGVLLSGNTVDASPGVDAALLVHGNDDHQRKQVLLSPQQRPTLLPIGMVVGYNT